MYHVTEYSHLEFIAKYGLIPFYDQRLGAHEMTSGKVINLVSTTQEAIRIVDHFAHTAIRDYGHDYFPIILEVEVPESEIIPLTGKKFRWYVTKNGIPSERIKVSLLPWEAQAPYLEEVRQEFENWKEANEK